MGGIKIVINVNVWVSMVISNKVSDIFAIIIHNDIQVFACNELKLELYDVFYREKHFKKFHSRVDVFLEQFQNLTEFLSIKHHRKINDCRDTNYNYLFDLVIQSQADYLVSGDDDVLDVKINPPPQIISFTEFREIFL